ncbi:glycosyltransferase [Ornithinimicrobium sp. W1679]|uniref:glycosyltransferase n=1 Tax=Ornithinimicrobium sp. W1679 TaxID=3418770 RepID=UPI003CFA9306
MDAAAGQFIITLDGDDRLSPSYAQEAVAVLEADAAATVAYPRVQEFGERNGLWWPGGGEELHLKAFAVHSPVAVASAFRRADWSAVGGFDESLRIGHEDYEFWVRLLGRCGGFAAGMPTATLYYRIRPGSRARTSWAEARANTRKAIVEGASRETLAALLVGSEEYARQLERELGRVQHDFLNVRSWPDRAERVGKRVRSRLRGSRRT